jgi:hypothetical protein
MATLQTIDESLFTELTADQAEMLEGGKRISILQVFCLEAGADADRSDELFFVINGQNFLLSNPLSMQRNSVVQPGLGVNFNGTASVSLMDKDGSSASGADLLGSFSASSIGKSQTATVSGSGSRYRVIYSVSN